MIAIKFTACVVIAVMFEAIVIARSRLFFGDSYLKMMLDLFDVEVDAKVLINGVQVFIDGRMD